MGKMPKPDKVLKRGIVFKLTSAYEWKPMQACLTSAGFFLSRLGGEFLRDLIPLYEIIDIRKRNVIPGEFKSHSKPETPKLALPRRGSYRNMVDCEEDVDLHIIQIRTVDDGCNGGRSYYFNVQSEEACADWVHAIRAEADRAILQMQAGPSLLRRLRFHVRRFYQHVVVQSAVALLIFFSFVVNITQTEVSTDRDPAAFDAFEYFFTIAFAAELALNMFANLVWHFLSVMPRPLPIPNARPSPSTSHHARIMQT